MDGGDSLLKHMRLQHGHLHDTLTSSERPDEGAALWGGGLGTAVSPSTQTSANKNRHLLELFLPQQSVIVAFS